METGAIECEPGLCITRQDREYWEQCQDDLDTMGRLYDSLEDDLAECRGRLEERGEGEFVTRQERKATELELRELQGISAVLRHDRNRARRARWYWAGGGVALGVAVTIGSLFIINRASP